jgi:membrane protease YdiL (CAAX protease family)
MSVSNPQYVVIGIFLAYTALVAVLWKVNKVDYATIGDTVRNAQRGIVVPIGAGAVLLAVAVTVLGAWHDSLFEVERSSASCALFVPVLFGLVGLVNLSTIDFRGQGREVLPWLALGTLLVGFSEEMVTRGVMVVGFREAGWSPVTVYLVATALFALLHGINVLFGQSMQQTLTQIVMAFAGGSALYVTRLTTGSLLVGMVLHALWDFSGLGIVATKQQQKPVAGALALASSVAGLVTVWFVI